jgi:hypothetical protein
MGRPLHLLKSPLGPAIVIIALVLLLTVAGSRAGAFLIGASAASIFDPFAVAAALIGGLASRRWWHVIVVAAVPIAIELLFMRPEYLAGDESWPYRHAMSMGVFICLAAGFLATILATRRRRPDVKRDPSAKTE